VAGPRVSEKATTAEMVGLNVERVNKAEKLDGSQSND
jgi:hypothetical protein